MCCLVNSNRYPNDWKAYLIFSCHLLSVKLVLMKWALPVVRDPPHGSLNNRWMESDMSMWKYRENKGNISQCKIINKNIHFSHAHTDFIYQQSQQLLSMAMDTGKWGLHFPASRSPSLDFWLFPPVANYCI